MKKLGKLSINPEKVMKNEELVNLRGGYGYGATCCYASTPGEYCNDSEAVMEAWASFWDAAGYNVRCYRSRWA